MPQFSHTSRGQLVTCEPELQILFFVVVETFDCTILEGFRCQHDQNKQVDEGDSQLLWPTGNHNSMPSKAADVWPYPLDPDPRNPDFERWERFGEFVLRKADYLDIRVTWGRHWVNFRDWGHWELAPLNPPILSD